MLTEKERDRNRHRERQREKGKEGGGKEAPTFKSSNLTNKSYPRAQGFIRNEE